MQPARGNSLRIEKTGELCIKHRNNSNKIAAQLGLGYEKNAMNSLSSRVW